MTDDHVLDVYNRSPLTIVSGRGAYLYSNNPQDQEYLDFNAGIGVSSLGHAHPRLTEVYAAQARKLIHVSNLYTIEGLTKALDTLCTISGFADKGFLSNSGTEANELALKMTFRYQFCMGRPERQRMISFQNAFHGRSMSLIPASDNPKMTEGFGGPAVDYDILPLGDLEAVKAAIGPETAGIILEPIQGEGGIVEATPEFLKGLRELCDAHDLVLTFDEIQSGAGRTGKFFSYQWHGVAPDIVTAAKGIGGGFPVSATLATDKIAQFMTAGTHGSTYSNNPMAVALVQAVTSVIGAPNFLERVSARGEYLKTRLEQIAGGPYDVIREVSGKGLMIGLKVDADPKEFVQRLQDHYLLAVAARNNYVRLLPPLIITTQEIDEGLAIIRKTAKSYARLKY